MTTQVSRPAGGAAGVAPLWRRLKEWLSRPGRSAVRCDVCGRWGYLLEWGGIQHVRDHGWGRGLSLEVHAIHYLRSQWGERVYRPENPRRALPGGDSGCPGGGRQTEG